MCSAQRYSSCPVNSTDCVIMAAVCAGAGCSSREVLDSRCFLRALENREHTCAKHRMLAEVHRRLKPAPAGLDVAQPPRRRRLSPRRPLPVRVQSARDVNVYEFHEDTPQPRTSRHYRHPVGLTTTTLHFQTLPAPGRTHHHNLALPDTTGTR